MSSRDRSNGSRSTRFQKGRSGNPRGRPKRVEVSPPLPALEPTSAALLASGSRLLTATENGKSVQLPASVAMMRAYERIALGGNRLALKDLIRLRREEEAIAAAEHRKDFDFWRTTKEKGEEALAKAKRADVPEPTLYPHPDDVQLDYDSMTATIDGPMSAKGAAAYQHNADLKRHSLRVAVYYGEWNRGAEVDAQGRPTIGVFTLFAALTALRLPKRMRPTLHDDVLLVMEAQGTPRRQLARDLALEGRRLGAEFYAAPTSMPAPVLPIGELPWLVEKVKLTAAQP